MKSIIAVLVVASIFCRLDANAQQDDIPFKTDRYVKMILFDILQDIAKRSEVTLVMNGDIGNHHYLYPLKGKHTKKQVLDIMSKGKAFTYKLDRHKLYINSYIGGMQDTNDTTFTFDYEDTPLNEILKDVGQYFKKPIVFIDTPRQKWLMGFAKKSLKEMLDGGLFKTNSTYNIIHDTIYIKNKLPNVKEWYGPPLFNIDNYNDTSVITTLLEVARYFKDRLIFDYIPPTNKVDLKLKGFQTEDDIIKAIELTKICSIAITHDGITVNKYTPPTPKIDPCSCEVVPDPCSCDIDSD